MEFRRLLLQSQLLELQRLAWPRQESTSGFQYLPSIPSVLRLPESIGQRSGALTGRCQRTWCQTNSGRARGSDAAVQASSRCSGPIRTATGIISPQPVVVHSPRAKDEDLLSTTVGITKPEETEPDTGTAQCWTRLWTGLRGIFTPNIRATAAWNDLEARPTANKKKKGASIGSETPPRTTCNRRHTLHAQREDARK